MCCWSSPLLFSASAFAAVPASPASPGLHGQRLHVSRPPRPRFHAGHETSWDGQWYRRSGTIPGTRITTRYRTRAAPGRGHVKTEKRRRRDGSGGGARIAATSPAARVLLARTRSRPPQLRARAWFPAF